jgi:hypothetical protein
MREKTGRILDVLNQLVDQTENLETLTNKNKNELLQKSLELVEYLIGNTDENPVDDWFC